MSFLLRFAFVTVAGAIAVAVVLAVLFARSHFAAIESDVIAQAVGQASAAMTAPLAELDAVHRDARRALPGIAAAATEVTDFQEYVRNVAVYWPDGAPIYPSGSKAAVQGARQSIARQALWRGPPFASAGDTLFSIYAPLANPAGSGYEAVLRLDFSTQQLQVQDQAEQRFVVLVTVGGIALLALSLITLALFAQRELNRRERIADRTLLETMTGIATIVDKRDPYTAGHSKRVAGYSVSLAREMGLNGAEVTTVERAALLHDLGKVGIPDAVLLKPERLDERERTIIGYHPAIANEILGPIEAMREIAPCVLHHHERFDGRGYPRKLAGTEIPLGARIIAVADSYDAMTTDRPYRRALSVEEARDEIRRCSGTQFDEACVAAFVRVVDRGEAVPPAPILDSETLARSFGPQAGRMLDPRD